MRRPRLDPQQPLISSEHLSQFETPKTWHEIFELKPRLHPATWQDVIVDADEYGFSLLKWTPAVYKNGCRRSSQPGTWSLTDKGREYIARRSRPHER